MIRVKAQRRGGTCGFRGRLVVTPGVQERLTYGQIELVLAKVQSRARQGNANRMQAVDVHGTEVWLVDDGDLVTMLLPHEY